MGRLRSGAGSPAPVPRADGKLIAGLSLARQAWTPQGSAVEQRAAIPADVAWDRANVFGRRLEETWAAQGSPARADLTHQVFGFSHFDDFDVVGVAPDSCGDPVESRTPQLRVCYTASSRTRVDPAPSMREQPGPFRRPLL